MRDLPLGIQLPDLKDFVFGVRMCVIFVAGSYFLGQLYFGSFEWSATVTGLSGVLAGLLGGQFGTRSVAGAYVVLALSMIVVSGVIFDAYDYYKYLDILGNSFGWHIKGPFAVSSLIIGWYCYKTSSARLLGPQQ